MRSVEPIGCVEPLESEEMSEPYQGKKNPNWSPLEVSLLMSPGRPIEFCIEHPDLNRAGGSSKGQEDRMLQKSSSLNITHLFINCPASFRCKKRSVEFQLKALALLGLICRQKKLAVRCPLIGNAFPDQQIALIGPLALPNI